MGFGLPASDFFRRLLHYYGVELQHLNTNSILQIAIFVHLCEAYLGIDPHFQLFRYLFRMKVTSATHNRCVGRAGLQLRQGMKDLYIPYELKQSVKEWYKEWFYVENQEPQLLGRSNMPPQRQLNWLKPLTTDEKTGIDELMTMIGDLKDQGLTGERVYLSFLMRRVQPLRSRSTAGYLYTGDSDPTRNLTAPMSKFLAMTYVKKYFPKCKSEPVEVTEICQATMTEEVRNTLSYSCRLVLCNRVV